MVGITLSKPANALALRVSAGEHSRVHVSENGGDFALRTLQVWNLLR